MVQVPAAFEVGITCQMASSMFAVAPSSNARRTNCADRSICRTPGASDFCTSATACFGDPACLADTRDLVGASSPAWPDRSPGRHPTADPPGKSRSAPCRIAPVSSSTATVAPDGHQVGQHLREMSRRPRRIRDTADRGRGRRAAPSRTPQPSRNGMNRCGCSSSASTIATGRSTCDSPASSSGQLAPGRVHDVAVAQQDEGVDALLPHRGAQPCAAFAVHPGEVGQCRECRAAAFRPQSVSDRSSSDTQELLDVGADDLHGVLGPDRLHDGCQ